MQYNRSVTEADHVTTLLGNDARNGIDQLKKAADFITSSLPSIADQLNRLSEDHGCSEATELIEQLEGALTDIGASAINANATRPVI